MNTFMLREVSCIFGLLEQLTSSHQLDDGFIEPGEVTMGFYLRVWDYLFHD